MSTKDQENYTTRSDEEVRKNLPSAVKLLRTLGGGSSIIRRIAWSQDGQLLASPSEEKICLWNPQTGVCIREMEGHSGRIASVAFDPTGRMLASIAIDSRLKLWDLAIGKTYRDYPCDYGYEIAWSPDGSMIASPWVGDSVQVIELASGKLVKQLAFEEKLNCVNWTEPHGILALAGDGGDVHLYSRELEAIGTLSYRSEIYCIARSPSGNFLAVGGHLNSISIWDLTSLKLVATLEGHTGYVVSMSFSHDGRFLASKSDDHTVRIWRFSDFQPAATIKEVSAGGPRPFRGLGFAPHAPLLATTGEMDSVIHLYEILFDELENQSIPQSVTYTSAKVVLVGDSGVGKTGLGWRLAHGEFKEHASTHGQQFWMLDQLSKQRRDGARCEAVLWDLAGQDDYRLIHALFLDDADLALVLFDPTRHDDPLSGVEFWLKQLKVGSRDAVTPTVLIAARSDRGTPRLVRAELEAFCKQRGIALYVPTSAKAGEGIDELIRHMQGLIPWDEKPATVTTETFKRTKDFVLNLKQAHRQHKVVLTPEELRRRLEETDRDWQFGDDEMLTAVGHLANHGYVTRLKTSQGGSRILISPDMLNNLAASFVLEARKNRKALGLLEEERLLAGGYEFPELEKLEEEEKDVLVDSAAILFLEHNVCFRETDPLNGRAYLVFPELINLKRPAVGDDDGPTEEGVSYTASGSVENVYASLVVLMGYTQTFTRTNQWQNQARYEVGQGFVCGFRQVEERGGELDFILYFSTNTPAAVRTLFQGLFESFLARRNLTVRRFEPAAFSNVHVLNRVVVRDRVSEGADFSFCNQCGEKISLPKADKPIQMTRRQAEEVETDRRAADQRSRFEQVLFRLKAYVTEHKIASPDCFISYAWGIPEQEHWVEKSLATDLQKAGISVVLDRWENARIGASVPRFVERVAKSDRVIVVGTLLYRTKYDNAEPMRGFVVAAEGDLIGKRMIGSDARKESVLPVLLEGIEESSFPPLLHGRVYADFRKNEDYFEAAFNLLMSLYGIKTTEPVVTELRATLEGPRA